MKVIIHDLPEASAVFLNDADAEIINANEKSAPCQGCFDCWTKHPAECRFKDALHTVCQTIGHADEMVIITPNCYGMYSAAVKNVLDRSIGLSTPFSTYRGRQMHHTLRYGSKEKLTIYVYGSTTQKEKDTFLYMAQRNAINYGFRTFTVEFLASPAELEEKRI